MSAVSPFLVCNLAKIDDLVVFGELASLTLGIDQVAVDFDVKDAARSFDHFGVDASFLLDDGRHTGGLGAVVSLHTKLNGDFHDVTSS